LRQDFAERLSPQSAIAEAIVFPAEPAGMSTSSYDNNLTISGYRPHPVIVGAAFAIILLGAVVGLVRGFLMTDRAPRNIASTEAGVSATQAAPSDQRLSPGDFLMAEAAEEELEPVKTEPVKTEAIPKVEIAPPPVAQTVQAIIEAPVAVAPPPPVPVTAEVLY
jgi:hypothetical protein